MARSHPSRRQTGPGLATVVGADRPAKEPPGEAVFSRPLAAGPLRLGLCCTFLDEPIRFRTTTATALGRRPRSQQFERLAELCRDNANALARAVEFCRTHGIGCFRVLSQILPLKTHPRLGYHWQQLPGGQQLVHEFQNIGVQAQHARIRLTFHPDQFVVLNSPRPEVVEHSLAELEYQAEVAEWLGADVINLHGGGAFGDKPAALDRLAQALPRLSDRARRRLTLENDDRVFTPADLEPLCHREGVPLVYDVHHHRCLPDGWSVQEATDRAAATWTGEPLFHISSPLEGWQGRDLRPHHDYLDPRDFPAAWNGKRLTVEVEAKAKERAVLRLADELRQTGSLLVGRPTAH